MKEIFGIFPKLSLSILGVGVVVGLVSIGLGAAAIAGAAGAAGAAAAAGAAGAAEAGTAGVNVVDGAGVGDLIDQMNGMTASEVANTATACDT